MMSEEERQRILRREKKRRYRARKRGVPAITGPALSHAERVRLSIIAWQAKEKEKRAA